MSHPPLFAQGFVFTFLSINSVCSSVQFHDVGQKPQRKDYKDKVKIPFQVWVLWVLEGWLLWRVGEEGHSSADAFCTEHSVRPAKGGLREGSAGGSRETLQRGDIGRAPPWYVPPPRSPGWQQQGLTMLKE